MAINSTRKLRAILCLTLLLFLLAVQIPAFAAVSGSTSMAEKGDKYVVTASYLNFRSGPGTSYPVVTGLKKGTTVTYMEYKGGWWRVKTSGGKTGYVDRKYLTPAKVDDTGKYFVTASALRVRKSPTTESSTVSLLQKGDIITISQLNGDWGYVSSGAGSKGWVALKYVSTNRPASSGSSGSYTVTADTLNVRSGASTHYERTDALKYGASVRVTQLSGSWGKISYSKNGSARTGWVKMDYLKAK